MSYILDALKKSDRERQSKAAPTIQTVHRPVKPGKGNSATLVAVITLLVVFVIGGGVYAWLVLQPTTTPAVTAQSDQPATPSAVPEKRNDGGNASEFAEVRPSTAPGPTVAFNALPDNVRNEIPALTFSFHVYSEKPENRTIIINNRRVSEGDEVLQHLLLREITPQGVVLQWKDSRFFINVVENW